MSNEETKIDSPSRLAPLERVVRQEPFELPVTRYRTAEGKPTCAANFETGDVCVFWRCRKFGQDELCGWNGETRLHRDGELGCLIPQDGCPLWNA